MRTKRSDDNNTYLPTLEELNLGLPSVGGDVSTENMIDWAEGTDVAAGGGILRGVFKSRMPKGLSRIQASEGGWKHPVGLGKNLNIPVDEVTALHRPYGNYQEEIVADIEKMQGGVLIPAQGDRTNAGQLLEGFNLGGEDILFPEPFALRGGHGYMREQHPGGDVWANNTSPASKMRNMANEVLEAGKVPYLGFLPMGHGASNFSTHASDALLQMMKGGDISKTAKGMFDRELRQSRREWLGIDSPGAMEQLDNTGSLRTEFLRVANKDTYTRSRGFPDPTVARQIITDPALMDIPQAHGLHDIGILSGETGVSSHKSFPISNRGSYFGSAPEGFKGIPRQDLFPDFFAKRRLERKPSASDHFAFERGKPMQNIDQEWIDMIMPMFYGGVK